MQESPSSSTKTSPKHAQYEEPNENINSKKSKKDGGISSYLNKIIGSRDPEPTSPTNSGSSMFYYDNLSSLRASKNTVRNGNGENEIQLPTNRNNDRSNFSSTLSPEVPEFVPASQRMNKAPGSNLKKDNSWATVDDSALEYLRPPPGLSKPMARNIWGLEENSEDRWGAPSVSKSSLFSDFKNDSSYSSLLDSRPKTSSTFSSMDLLTSFGNREDKSSSNIWKSEGSNIDKDLFGSSTSLRSSIWDAPEPIIPPSSVSGSLSARSRLGLGLDLKPVSEVGIGDATETPLDPFSIWGLTTDPSSPYEGWNQDIKDD